MAESHKGKRVPKSTDVLNVDQVKEIKRRLVSMEGAPDIARELEVPYRAINNTLSNDTFSDVDVAGWSEFRDGRQRKRHGVSDDEIEMMKTMRSDGVSINDIAKQIGCTRHTVRKYLAS